jgi:hypothetical protein
LGSGEDAGLSLRESGEVMSEEAETDGLAGAGIAGDESESTVADEAFHAPAEVIELRRAPQGRDWDIGGKGVPLEAEKGKQLMEDPPPPGRRRRRAAP